MCIRKTGWGVTQCAYLMCTKASVSSQHPLKPSTVLPTCNNITKGARETGKAEVQGHPGLHSESEVRPACDVRGAWLGDQVCFSLLTFVLGSHNFLHFLSHSLLYAAGSNGSYHFGPVFLPLRVSQGRSVPVTGSPNWTGQLECPQHLNVNSFRSYLHLQNDFITVPGLVLDGMTERRMDSRGLDCWDHP